MSACQHIYAKNLSFRIEDAAGASMSLTGDGNSFSLEYTADLIEATTFGDENRTHITSIKDYTATYAGFYSHEGSDPASALHEIVGASQGTWFQANPSGSAGTCPGWSGCVHIESLSIEAPVDGIITTSFTLRPRSGSLTYADNASW